MNWQPISTAPKDGTSIIVMYMHIETQVVHSAFWMDEQDCWDGDNPVGWWSYVRSEVSRELLDEWRTPTHWMPLPAKTRMCGGCGNSEPQKRCIGCMHDFALSPSSGD